MHPANLVSKDQSEAREITALAFEKEASGGDGEDLLGLAGEARMAREEALRKKLAQMANRQAKFISAEEFAIRRHQLELAEWQPTMKWHSEPVTEKQKPWLEKAGINLDTVQFKGHASKLLDIIFQEAGREPASHKQKWVLRQAGFRSPDGLRGADEATREDARAFFASRNPKPAQPEAA